jgi:hypothetical protein
VEQDQGVSCDGRLPDFFRREVGSKSNGTDWWQRRQAKSFGALLVKHCPRRHDPAKPIPDGWILQKAGCYHGAVFTELAAEQGGMAQ